MRSPHFLSLPVRHINCSYLTNTIPHVTSAHLGQPKKCRFLQLNSPTAPLPSPPFLLPLMLPSTPLQSDNQLWRFSPGFRPTIGCFSSRGKNAPCPPHDRPNPGRNTAPPSFDSQNSSCSPSGEVQLYVFMFPTTSCLPDPLVMWVGGL